MAFRQAGIPGRGKMKRLLIFLLCFAFAALACALETPVISSASHPDQERWYSGTKIEFEWSGIQDASYYYALNREESAVPEEGASPTTAESEVSFEEGKLDGVWYFHLRARKGSEWSETAHYKINIDRTKPGGVAKLRVEPAGKGELKLTWEETTDTYSGVAGYRIYRSPLNNFDVRDPSVTIASESAMPPYTDSGLGEGTTSHYKVQAVDKAGNRGATSFEICARTVTYCALNITIGAERDALTNQLLISVGSDAPMYYASLSALLPDQSVLELSGSQSNITSISRTYDLNQTPNGNIQILLAAKDSGGDVCDQNSTFAYDTVAPEGSWVAPEENAVIADAARLEVMASDPGEFRAGIASVGLSYEDSGGWALIGGAQEADGGVFAYDWNASALPNGRYTLRALITDNAGNTYETKRKFTIENVLFAISAAEDAINGAEADKNAALEFKIKLDTQDIASQQAEDLLAWADDNLSKAVSLYGRGYYYERAKEHAELASSLYKEALSSIEIAPYKSSNYFFTLGQITPLFEAAGLKKELADGVKDFIVRYKAGRSLEVSKVTDGNSTYYKVGILLHFANTDKNALDVQVIECVPKEFAQKSDLIFSATDFAVLREDPIINFRPATVLFGDRLELRYSIKGRLSKEDAERFIDGDVINKFAVPPIFIDAGAQITADSFAQPAFDFGRIFGNLGGFLGGTTTLLIVAVVVIIILLLVIAAIILIIAILYFMSRRNRRR